MVVNTQQTLIKKIKNIIEKTILSTPVFLASANINISDLSIEIEKNRDLQFGDFNTNFLMKTGLKFDQIAFFAEILINKIKKKRLFTKIKFAKPGYINFSINNNVLAKYLENAIRAKQKYGKFKPKKLFYNIEYVSANPTGLLHVGHARNAAFGSALVNVWKAYGIRVNSEFYINDAGAQIDRLALSVLIRYLQLCNQPARLPADSYHGTEIVDAARVVLQQHKKKFANTKYDKNHICNPKVNKIIKEISVNFMLENIKNTLTSFHVNFNIWTHETDLYKYHLIDEILKRIKPYTYHKDGALFFQSTKFKDEKDRVLIKSDGTYTYFLPDIAYHDLKLSRGYDKIFNIWGADHAEYVNRIKMSLAALNYNPNVLHVFLQQMVKIVRDGKEIKMSKRTGNSLTLVQLVKLIGKQAAHWYLVSTSFESTHLEIDIDKVTSKSNDNPFYYVQYAYARINQLLKNYHLPLKNHVKVDRLTLPIEHELLLEVASFNQIIELIAQKYDLQKLPGYLINLCKTFHTYYSAHKINDGSNNDAVKLSEQRINLARGVMQVIYNGLKLINIYPSKEM